MSLQPQYNNLSVVLQLIPVVLVHSQMLRTLETKKIGSVPLQAVHLSLVVSLSHHLHLCVEMVSENEQKHVMMGIQLIMIHVQTSVWFRVRCVIITLLR